MTNLLDVKGIETLEEKSVRDNLVERVEVLSRVKELVLLPNIEAATLKQVSDFYSVNEVTVKQLVRYHNEEFKSDGYKAITGSELKELKGQIGNLSTLKHHSRLAIFTKRAILRVGMFLRDSEVAKEVRNQLLNIEEHASKEVKTYEIDMEQELHMKVGKALSEGDMFAFGQAIKELEDYKNRHMIEKAEKWEAFLDDDGTVSIQFVGKKFLGGLSSQKTRERLQSKGVLFMKQTNGAYLPKKGYEKYFFIKIAEYNGVQNNQTRVTREGIDFIVDLVNK